jgi:Transglutaminase-like superfamily
VTRLRKFIALPAQERCLFVRTAFLMTTFRLGLWLLPFSRLLAFTRPAEHPVGGGARLDPAPIVRAVQVVSRWVPGATCLVQALTGKALLERAGLPATLHIGVAKDIGEFEAHAWVECRGAVVIGGSGDAHYTRLLSVELTG